MSDALVYGMTYKTRLTYTVMKGGLIAVSFCELTAKRQIEKRGTFHFFGTFQSWSEAFGIWPKETCQCVVKVAWNAADNS